MNRLYIDIKEDCRGNLTGPVKLPADARFTFEALAEIISLFSKSCDVPPSEIIDDLRKFLK